MITNDERRKTVRLMIGELRDIARTLEDYSDGYNSMALYELAKRVDAVADAIEAEEAAAAKYVAEREV